MYRLSALTVGDGGGGDGGDGSGSLTVVEIGVSIGGRGGIKVVGIVRVVGAVEAAALERVLVLNGELGAVFFDLVTGPSPILSLEKPLPVFTGQWFCDEYHSEIFLLSENL